MDATEILEKVETLQNILIARSTGGVSDDEVYVSLRQELMAEALIKKRLPRFVRTCRSLDQLWGFIKVKFATYAERRSYIWNEFRPLLDMLEKGVLSPADHAVSATLSALNAEHVDEIWRKAMERRSSDPEGAVTLARTLLESVCKLILDEMNISYGNRDDLPKLYYLVAEQLQLAPSQHSEELFKTILGNCQSVVGSLAAIRNLYSDAHGQGKIRYKPLSRHAELAVNLAGAMAMFLIRTWEEKGAA
ncbi:MAG: abortive infection family protein [Anaerolineales bacterium]|nr:abortive infection family protein [Anaerolineales bacterium]